MTNGISAWAQTLDRGSVRGTRWYVAITALLAVATSSCTAGRAASVGPVANPAPIAETLRGTTRLEAPARIDFRWVLNEQGARVSGVGVARIEPPFRARLDLFLDNNESVISAALVDDDLRLPPGAPDDVLPPVELMWGTLGVFRPFAGTRLAGGERLADGGERLRYVHPDGRTLDFETRDETLGAVELLEGETLLEWVRLEMEPDDRYPRTATYRNLVDFRELEITRTSVRSADPFDPAIWDPR